MPIPIIKVAQSVPLTSPVAPIANTTQAGLLNQVSGVGTDYVGGDNTCHGLVAALPIATATVGGLVPTPPNDVTQYLRGDATFVVPPARNFYRYIRQRHCDSPLTGADVSAVSGTGAAIASAVNPTTVNAGHPGIWSMISGTVANNYASLLSSSIGPEFNLSVLNKIALRFVFKIGAAVPSGAVGATTFAQICAGLVATPNSGPSGAANAIEWRFNSAIGYWTLFVCNGSSYTDYPTSTHVVPAINTWYDLRIYWDTNGVIGKAGLYGGTMYSTGLQTTNVPVASTSMYWQLNVVNGSAGTTSYTIFPSMYEIVGETSTGLLLGDQLITAF